MPTTRGSHEGEPRTTMADAKAPSAARFTEGCNWGQSAPAQAHGLNYADERHAERSRLLCRPVPSVDAGRDARRTATASTERVLSAAVQANRAKSTSRRIPPTAASRLARASSLHAHAFALDLAMTGRGNNGHLAPSAWTVVTTVYGAKCRPCRRMIPSGIWTKPASDVFIPTMVFGARRWRSGKTLRSCCQTVA